MFPRYFTIAILTVCIGLLMVSCYGAGTSLTTPDTQDVKVSQSTSLGAFRIIPGDNLESASIQKIRSAQFDVSQWADIEILAMDWDSILRTWTLTVKVSNPSNFTGYGVQAIFTELGGKEMRWPDGYVWMNIDGTPEDERVPFFAIEKDTLGREFAGLHSSTRDLVFYFPEGVNLWLPIDFFLDAHLHEPRPDPMVEDMGTSYFTPPCVHAAVTAKIDDHQCSLDEINVWVDLTDIGGSDVEPLYDDGEHDDGLAGDGVFGVSITGGIFGELYTFTVYAEDPDGNIAENDAFYSPILYPPLLPLSFKTLMQDQFCLLIDERFQVIEDQIEWEEFWGEFSPWDMPAPEVDFDLNNVIAVCIGQRDNDCYFVNIDNFTYSTENCGVKVDYTETVPTEGCECAEIITSPFHLVTASKTPFDTMFAGVIFEDCPQDPCLDLYEVAKGFQGVATTKTKTVIFDQPSWEAWWASSVGGSDTPWVNFETDMVIALTMGVHNTGGFYPTIDSACWDDTMQLEITIGWHSPGPGCYVTHVITYPYLAVKCEKTLLPYVWDQYNDVYSCD